MIEGSPSPPVQASQPPQQSGETPLPKKRLQVKDIADKAKVKGIYLVTRKVVATDKNGKSYLSVLLSDRTGQIDARAFENAEKLAAAFEEQDHVKVSGLAKSFQGRLQLHLYNIERAPEEDITPDEYLPSSARDGESMWRELLAAVDSIRDDHLRALLRALLDDPEVAAKLRRCPAARTIHHAWIGGLLEHNLSVYRIIDGLCAHYAIESPGLLDRDLCVAGGLLHDFGKIYELSAEGRFDYTHEGRLIGHLVLCSEKIAAVAATLPGFPRGRLLELQHIVLAHHDRLEYGSPKRPKTAEAMLVHAADVLDSRMAYLRQLFTRESGAGWTSYQKVYDRPFYYGGRGPDPGERGPLGVPPVREAADREARSAAVMDQRAAAALAGDDILSDVLPHPTGREPGPAAHRNSDADDGWEGA